MADVRRIWMVIIFFGLIITSAPSMEIKNLSQAVDVAGKQRMFTQRMLKDYIMVGMKNYFHNPEKDLKSIMVAFEDHMESLYDFATDIETKKSIEVSKKLWKPTKMMLGVTPTIENAKVLQVKLEALLRAADETTKRFAKLTGKKSGRIINISGRQRMLSQRITALYMMKSWGISNLEIQEKMGAAMKLFRDSHQKLKAYERNNPEINRLLEKVGQNFMSFEVMYDAKALTPSLLFEKSMMILKDMNRVTGLYAEMGALE